jgi:fibronectin type III domain protein
LGETTHSGLLPVGGYSLEVGRSGSFAHYEQESECKNASALADALGKEEDERPKPVAAIEEFQESADAVTGRVEQADQLLKAAADGQLLDLSNVSGEIDALLDLFGRLDRAGRFEEELRLMRSLNGLLALAMRWLALIRSLRSLLRSAETAGDAAAQAFAHHELGSLYLCAGRPKEAVKHLREADQLRLQDRLADLSGQCATRHNLDSAERDLALQTTEGTRPPTRLQRLVVLAGAIAIAAASGAGIALAVHRHGPSSTTSTTQPTTSTSTPTSTSASTPTSTQTTTQTHTQTQPVQLPAPTGLNARAISPTEIDISWRDPPAISSYVIYRDSQKLAPVFGNTTSYHDIDVAPSHTYVYRVQALAADGKPSQESPPKSVTTPPSAPTNLVATESSTPDEMDLTWTPPIDDPHVTGYIIYRVEYATAPPDTDTLPDMPLATVGKVAGYSNLPNPNPAVLTNGPFIDYSDPKVNYGSTYGYSVRAVDTARNSSEPSNLAWATEAGG